MSVISLIPCNSLAVFPSGLYSRSGRFHAFKRSLGPLVFVQDIKTQPQFNHGFLWNSSFVYLFMTGSLIVWTVFEISLSFCLFKCIDVFPMTNTKRIFPSLLFTVSNLGFNLHVRDFLK